MMKIPDSIWAHTLREGMTLSERVGGIDPTYVPVEDWTAFRNVWEQRLEDAKFRNLSDLEEKSKAVLQFTARHMEIVLLIWPSLKLTAIFSPQDQEILIMEQ